MIGPLTRDQTVCLDIVVSEHAVTRRPVHVPGPWHVIADQLVALGRLELVGRKPNITGAKYRPSDYDARRSPP